MKAKIFSYRHLIGTTDLIVGDKNMGCVFGKFLPTNEYYKNIQKKVWEFWHTNKPDYEKWHSLRINVQLENGLFLFPDGGYTINDVKELPYEPKRIDIAGIDSRVVEDFLLTQSTGPFVDKPWSDLKIEQKIAFEDELKKEIGSRDKLFFNLFTNKTKHILSDIEFSAFCHDQRNDDVLFAIRKVGFEKRFALVHLTWTSKTERVGYPITRFYSDFEEFKSLRMYVDKVDYES